MSKKRNNSLPSDSSRLVKKGTSASKNQKPAAQATRKTKAKTKSQPSMLPFELDSIGDLADFLKSKGIAEFEWSKGDTKIVLRTGTVHTQVYSNASIGAQNAAPTVVSSSSSNASGETKEPASYKRVLSPFVGTFYKAPSPNAPTYADVGKRVAIGDTLCIVEAMKLMNEIEADFAGKVVQVLVENGQPVEFGEPLFLIDTA
jgi:acetyl-CoA carboxylase biotin carboxyl carrier protein